MSKIKDFFGKLCGKNEKEKISETKGKSILEEELEKRGAINPPLAAALIGAAMDYDDGGEPEESEIVEAIDMLSLSEPYMFRSESAEEASGSSGAEAEVMSDSENEMQEGAVPSTGGDHTGAVFSADMMSDSEYYKHLGI